MCQTEGPPFRGGASHEAEGRRGAWADWVRPPAGPSGEPFDSHACLAGHYDLPFDARVRVRNLNTGRDVELRINDRVPSTP